MIAKKIFVPFLYLLHSSVSYNTEMGGEVMRGEEMNNLNRVLGPGNLCVCVSEDRRERAVGGGGKYREGGRQLYSMWASSAAGEPQFYQSL